MTQTAASSPGPIKILGEPKSVRFPDVESATVIYPGTFVILKSGSTQYVTPVTTLADAGDAAANREAAADLFVGIALDGSASGATSPIRVAGAGTQFIGQFQTAATIEYGDELELYADADNSSDTLMVEGTTSPIAVCIKTNAAASTDVWCELLPTKVENAWVNS